MGSKRLESLTDYHRHGLRLRVDCLACKRVAILVPLTLSERCKARGWRYGIEQVTAQLVCAECGSKRVRCGSGI